MFTNKVLCFAVCGLSLALGACAVDAEEGTVGEGSAALSKDSRIEMVGQVPDHAVKGIEKVDSLPDYKTTVQAAAAPKGTVEGLDNSAAELAVGAEKSGPSIIDPAGNLVGELAVEAPLQLSERPMFKFSGSSQLQAAGNDCKHCAR